MKRTAIDFVKDISQNKKDILDEGTEAMYKPYIINKYLSMHPTTVMYANEMNIHNSLPKRMQYDYYLHSIKKQSRFFKYVKQSKLDDIELVKEYFGYNYSKAKDALSVLSHEDLDYMRTRIYKGGKNAK